MRRATRLGLGGLAVVGLGLIASGPLRARQVPLDPGDTNDCRPIQPNTLLVAAPPHTVAWTRTWLQLQKVEPLEYPDGIKLGDFLKRIREATRAPELGFPRGVPIYTDLNGLREVDRSIDAMVTLDLDGVTLAKALTLGLRQISLTMRIDPDGLIVVTSNSADDFGDVPTSPDDAEWTRLDQIHSGIRGIQSQMNSLRREVTLLREALRLPPETRPATTGLPTPPAAPTGPLPIIPSLSGGFR